MDFKIWKIKLQNHNTVPFLIDDVCFILSIGRERFSDETICSVENHSRARFEQTGHRFNM